MVRIEASSALPSEAAKCGDMNAGNENTGDFMGMLFNAMLSAQQVPQMVAPLANMTIPSEESNAIEGTMNSNMTSLLTCLMPAQMMPGDMLQNNSDAFIAPAGVGPGLLMQDSNTGNLLLENMAAEGNLIPQTAAVQSAAAEVMPAGNVVPTQAQTTGVSNNTAPAAGFVPQPVAVPAADAVPVAVPANAAASPAAELTAIANQVLLAAAATEEQPRVVMPQLQSTQADVNTREISTDSSYGVKPLLVNGVMVNDGGQEQGGLNQHTNQGDKSVLIPGAKLNQVQEIAYSGSAEVNKIQDVVNGSLSKSWGETVSGEQVVATQQGHQVVELGSLQVKQTPQALLSSVIQMANYRENVAGPISTSIKLKLEPKNLGEMTVKLSYTKGELTAHFYTSSIMAKDAVEGTLPQLKELLTQHNIQLTDAAAFVGQENTQQSGQGRYQQNDANYQFFADNDEVAAFSELMPQDSKDDGGGLNRLV